jgi:acetate kinase
LTRGDGPDLLGLQLDPARNETNAPVISADGSRVTARVIPTNEELRMAEMVLELLGIRTGS